MNKKLLAVAVAGALSAPVVALAQSSVTLYGSADVAMVNKIYKTGAGQTFSVTQGIGEGWNAGNRIGFRGSEDLGGGMSAQFLIEQGINLTNGQLFSTRAAAGGQQYDSVGIAAGPNMVQGAYSTATNRQSFVGLKGGWGELLGGYQYTTLYRISTLSGYFNGSEQPGGDTNHGTLDNGNYGGTRANGLVYNSPMFMDGFQVTVQRGAGSGREAASFASAQPDGRYQNNAKRWSIMPTYNKGPLSVALGYTSFDAQSNGLIAGATCFQNVFGVCTSAPAVAGAASTDLRAHLWQVGASYKIGSSWDLTGTYANGVKKDGGINATTGVVAGVQTKSKAYQFGVEYKTAAWRPFAQVGRGTVDQTPNAALGARINDIKTLQFGLRYDLSKRTMIYAMRGRSNDDSQTGAGAGIRRREGTALGMYMSF